MMSTKYAVLVFALIWAHLILAGAYALSFIGFGLCFGFVMLWIIAYVAGIALYLENLDAMDDWDERRKAKKKKGEPSKGDWKG